MNNAFTNKHNDDLVNAAAAVLFTEDLSTVKELVSKVKVGSVTNFGVVKAITDDSISFKAKDLPLTKIKFNQRKIGSKDFVLDKLILIKEDALEENELDEAKGADPKKLRDLIYNHTQLLAHAPDARAKEFHKVAIANAKEKLKALGEEIEESLEDLDEAKGADPANLRTIIQNHTALLNKATDSKAKEFHRVAIANAREKLKSLGEDIEESIEDQIDEAVEKPDFKDFLSVQKEGMPLINKDGQEVKDTVYLGDNSYLWKKGTKYIIATFGVSRKSSDGSLVWSKWMQYDDQAEITKSALKGIEKHLTKL